MKDRYYQVTILLADEHSDCVYNPTADADTHEEAVAIALPWLNKGYDVTITTQECAGREYIEIPLDSYEFIENLTNVQKGIVLKSIYGFFFNGHEPESNDPIALEAAVKMINRIKEYENGQE